MPSSSSLEEEEASSSESSVCGAGERSEPRSEGRVRIKCTFRSRFAPHFASLTFVVGSSHFPFPLHSSVLFEAFGEVVEGSRGRGVT